MVHIYLIVSFSEICKELQQVQAMLLEDDLEKLYEPDKRVCYQKAEEAYSTGGSAMDKSKKKSIGWMLLFRIRMKNTINMTQEELWKSDEHFHCYPFQDFKRYDNDTVGELA
jgi:hypothetical protein